MIYNIKSLCAKCRGTSNWPERKCKEHTLVDVAMSLKVMLYKCTADSQANLCLFVNSDTSLPSFCRQAGNRWKEIPLFIFSPWSSGDHLTLITHIYTQLWVIYSTLENKSWQNFHTVSLMLNVFFIGVHPTETAIDYLFCLPLTLLIASHFFYFFDSAKYFEFHLYCIKGTVWEKQVRWIRHRTPLTSACRGH